MRRRTHFMAYVLVVSLVVAIVLLIGYQRGLHAFATATAAPGSLGTPVSIAITTTVTAPNSINSVFMVDGTIVPLNQACQDHTRPLPRLIVDATMGNIARAGHWNAPGGLRPTNISTQKISPFSIVTLLHFSEIHTIVDTRTAPTNEMVTLGGKAGADQIQVMGGLYPSLQPHQRYLLFFDRGQSDQQLVAVAAYRIV